LQEITSLLGLKELSANDRKTVERARRLIRFLTQPFAVTAQFTGHEGVSVDLADTLDGCEAILGGQADDRVALRKLVNDLIRDARKLTDSMGGK
jgi:F-type H+-transporting ATPase subunit beta